MNPQSEHDYPNEFHSENGFYVHMCLACGAQFFGNKHRHVCRKCQQAENARRSALSAEQLLAEQEEFARQAEELLEKLECKEAT